MTAFLAQLGAALATIIALNIICAVAICALAERVDD